MSKRSRTLARATVAARPARIEARRSISIPVLVGTAVAMAVLLPGLYLWRAQQVEHGASAYLDRAETLATQEQWAESAEYLFLYLRMRPEDADAKIQLAKTYDRLASHPAQLSRAIELYYQAVARAPAKQQRELRLRLAELLIQSQRFAEAVKETETLISGHATSEPTDPAVERTLALALYGSAKSGGLGTTSAALARVGKAMEDAARSNRGDVQVAVTLADIYRNEPTLLSEAARKLSHAQRQQLADECLDRLIDNSPDRATAHLARYQYREINSLSESDADLRRALELAPENPVVLLAAGDHCRRKYQQVSPEARSKQLQEATQLYERAIQLLPQMERAYLGLGETQLLEQKPGLAVKTFSLGVEKCGEPSILLNLRLAEELLALGELEQAEDRVEAVEATATKLRQRGILESELGFAQVAALVRARLLLARSDADAAIAILGEVATRRTGGNDERRFQYQALMRLGEIYASRGQYDQATHAFEDAELKDSSSPEPWLATARTWMTANQPQRALTPLKKAVTLAGTFANHMLLAGANLRSQMALPAAERNWDEVEQSLRQAKSVVSDADAGNEWRWNVLEAEYLVSRGSEQAKTDSGRVKALQSLRIAEGNPEISREGIEVLALAYERLGAPKEANRVIHRLQERFPGFADTHLTAAAIMSQRQELSEAEAMLAKAIEAVPPSERFSLRQGLATLRIRQGEFEAAWSSLESLQRDFPQDHDLLVQLLELAIDTRRFEQAAQLEMKLKELPRSIEREWQYYHVRRLLAEADGPNDPRLNDAEATLRRVQEGRTDWPAGRLLSAELLERRGDLAAAVAAYKEAIRSGDRRLPVYERTILLLYQLERYDEADKYLREVATQFPAASSLSTLQISNALRVGQLDQALQLARLGVEKRPMDPLAHVWLGQLLLASEKPVEAENALRSAINVGPSDPRAHGALVNFFARTNRLDEARTTIEEFARAANVAPLQKALILAAGYQAIGDQQQAVVHLREAEKLAPDNATVQERLASSLLASDPGATEQALRRALELDPKSVTARRMLAGLLANQTGEQSWREALQILEHGDDSAANQQLKALLIARRGGADNLAQARRLLETMTAERQEAAPGRLLLAQIREAEGDQVEAQKIYQTLASAVPPQTEVIAAYAEYLLRQKRVEEATTWLDKLDKLNADSPVALSLRVRWLSARNQDKQIAPLLERAADQLLRTNEPEGPSRDRMVEVSLIIGNLYFLVDDVASAERWYQRAYRLDASQYGRLARCRAMRGQIAEAIELCVDAAANDTSSSAARILATILAESEPNSEAAAKADPLLARALADHASDPVLLETLATLRLVQRRVDEACQLYRRTLEIAPKNVNTLNNLATALSELPDHREEALQYIDQAIELAGPQPNLLDTKGTILLSLNKLAEAVPLLDAAASAPGADPRYYFHLAVGHCRSGDLGKARNALRTARDRDLERTVLTESDNRMLAELDASLR